MKIFIVGSGKLANALITADLSAESSEIVRWEAQNKTFSEKSVIVHAGSGRQLKEVFEFCARTKSPFIELSTGLETETMDPDFPLINCPNTSILLLKTLNMLKEYGRYFEDYEISITESHQSAKKTEPGTAFALANSLKFPPEKIISVRDPEIQQNEIGIPEEYLEKHAYHKIIIREWSDEVTIETKVLGHESYARGVKTIIEMVLKTSLENRRYTILELNDKNR